MVSDEAPRARFVLLVPDKKGKKRALLDSESRVCSWPTYAEADEERRRHPGSEVMEVVDG